MAFKGGQVNQDQAREKRKARREAFLREAGATSRALERVSRPLPDWGVALLRRAAQGEVKALVGVKCGDCVCWERKEIAECPIVECGLHPLRPYKKRGEGDITPSQDGN